MEKLCLFGLKIHNISREETLSKIDKMIKQGGTHLVVTLGVEMIMRAEKDGEFFNIINEASLVVPDSVGVLWACKKMGCPLKERVTGVDLIVELARNFRRYPWKVFFLGGKPNVAKEAALKLSEKYPPFEVVGTHHGYFSNDKEVIEMINSSKAQILFIGMGFPAQEKWFFRNRDKFKNMVAIGVGGSFDVLSGRLKRAPQVLQNIGLEWLYRLITQPSRIRRMKALPLFALKVMLKKDLSKR